jgi:hypothetical protein
MAAYVDFTYYTGTYGGTAIASTDFTRLANRATVAIDLVTFAQAAAVITAATDTATIDKIKMATCAVAEEYQRLDVVNGGSKEIASEKVGTYSVTYVAGADDAKSMMGKLADAARLYLWNTGLMYGGPEIVDAN